MKFHFESNQEYQLRAIESIVNIFDGQPLKTGEFELDFENINGTMLPVQIGFGNKLVLSKEDIEQNVRKIQEENSVGTATELESMDFSIEMETGTGKTYVYLRTIYELNEKFGFNKFVVLVPSIAIREGVLKNLEITKEHFQEKYVNVPVNYWVYDSDSVSKLRQFATSNQLQILVINIDALNKDTNIINTENDRLSGNKPIEFIQSTYPIVIIDEPQNMEGEKAKEAIKRLNPLCTLRYSATHRNLYNLMYKFDPVMAYDKRLVKKIEIASIIEEDNFNAASVFLEKVNTSKTKVTAKVRINVNQTGKAVVKSVIIKKDDDLYDLSGYRDEYKGNWIVDEINYQYKYIVFANSKKVYEGQGLGLADDEVLKQQIKETVREHFDKEAKFKAAGLNIKVLSLFFVDKVANYRSYETGTGQKGKFAFWFEEAFREFAAKDEYRGLIPFEAEQVHNGYFSQDKKGWKDTKGNTESDKDTYKLIMRDKEQLLSVEEPLRFIFSHSALREGWDNPNIFQICTLRETKSEIARRQEIGRGLRLPVDKFGYRIKDETISILTVIANESFADFAGGLQKEIEDECGISFEGRIVNKKDRKKVQFKKDITANIDFLELWNRINFKTRYAVEYKTDELIKAATKAINKMPRVKKRVINVQKSGIEKMTDEGFETRFLGVHDNKINETITFIPDVISYIQKESNLTRNTIKEILIGSERLNDLFVNPQQFLNLAITEIKHTLNYTMVYGIKYEKLEGQYYDMMKFEEKELESYISKLLKVKNSIYDYIPYDSNTEKTFAQNLSDSPEIKLFFKLPTWFVVKTPIGEYNPDWAIVKQTAGEEKLYLIRETKKTSGDLDVDFHELRDSEAGKILCGERHFREIGVDYKVVSRVEDI